jgi:hypothetical protein
MLKTLALQGVPHQARDSPPRVHADRLLGFSADQNLFCRVGIGESVDRERKQG